jgi:hypothetical protein
MRPRQVRDYGGHVVLIEPLATLKAVHDFLWSKVAEEGPEEGRPGRSKVALPDAPAPSSAPAPAAAGGDGGCGDAGEEDADGEEEGDWGEEGDGEGDGDGLLDGEDVAALDDDADDDGGGGGGAGPGADITRPTPAKPHGQRGAAEAGGGAERLVLLVRGRQLPQRAPIIQAVGALAGDCGEAGGGPAACKAAWEQVRRNMGTLGDVRETGT